MSPILISVIMPVYNAHPYLEEAIESVLKQSYQNWELLLADDGSSDESVNVSKEYSKKYPGKIYFFNHPEYQHFGTIATRNLAILHSRGSYVAFLDADDLWLPDKLSFQVSLIEQYPEAGMICGATNYWYSWSDPWKKDREVFVGCAQDSLITPPDAALSLYPLGEGDAPCLCSMILRKEVALYYRDLDQYFSGKYQLYEDQAFLIRVYLRENIFVSSKVFDFYRQRSDSTMHSGIAKGQYNEVRYFFLKWLKKYIRQEGIKNKMIKEKIREAMYPYAHPLIYKIKKTTKRLRLPTLF